LIQHGLTSGLSQRPLQSCHTVSHCMMV
jgi:hypothetical protein